MTDVKKPWDENIEMPADAGGGGTGEAAAKLGQVAVIGEQPGGAAAGGGAFDVGQAVTGIAGGTLAGGMGGAAGGIPGGVTGIVAEGGGVPDILKTAKSVDAAVKIGQPVADAVGGMIKGPVGQVVGAVAGGVVGAVAEGALGLIKDGVPKANIVSDLPIFEEKAITSSVPKPVKGLADKVMSHLPGGLGGKGILQRGKNLEVEIASGDGLDVRQFSVHERLSSLFQVNLVVVSENASIEFDEVVGQPAKFKMAAGMHERFWSGICNHFEQVKVEPTGLSTYQLSIVPTLWLLTQRKNHRMFQQISEPDIVQKLLKEWDIEPVVRIDKGAYKKRKYRIQYAESDYAFMSRMLEDAGITFYFEQEGGETKLVLSDAPQSNPKRGMPLSFVDDTSMVRSIEIEYVTGVRMGQRVRPGKYTVRDHDYRKPANYKLMKTASKGLAVEEKLERFQYAPGAFLFGTDSGDATPVADDKGKTRTDEKEGEALAQRRLDAKRGSARVATFETNAHDLAPGVVMSMGGHPHSALGDGKDLLVVESSLSGADRGEWSHYCEARGVEVPFRPELVTPKPTVNGVESATVVGPAGEEIHTDEFGRVRVHFHWDRESKMDDNSSCWIHVSQPWGGSGYGGSNLPRVGQEVLVDFLGGDPDRPVIVGRVYTNLQKTPYKLPDNKTQSGWKSMSSPGGGASNFNELMFEDKKGQELVRMQAEKDLTKLVKHDESVTIGNDRAKQVGHDDALTVGHDRSRQVVHDETVQIGNDRTRLVGNNESVTVGSNRTKVIGANESLWVGSNQTEEIGANRSVQVGANHSETIGTNMSVMVGGALSESVGLAKSETVALASAEIVGALKSISVGGAFTIAVGAGMTTTVNGSHAETVTNVRAVSAGSKVFIECGAANVTIDKGGLISIEAVNMKISASGEVQVNADSGVKVSTSGTVKVKAGVVKLN